MTSKTGGMTAQARQQRARIGAHAAHAKHGRHHMTEAARAANPSRDTYWEREVDPDDVLSESERRTRAYDAKRAYFAGLSLKSATARRRQVK
jgi:hypothetical protein